MACAVAPVAVEAEAASIPVAAAVPLPAGVAERAVPELEARVAVAKSMPVWAVAWSAVAVEADRVAVTPTAP